MDNRFKNLDNELRFEPSKEQIDSLFNEFDNLALDNAFKEAIASSQHSYSSLYWDSFIQQESILNQDISFNSAALDYNSTYNPAYWNQAQEALINEGLHYQYKSAYWSEAEKLLVKADKKAFFARWVSIASIFLIIGMLGINMSDTSLHKNFQFSATQYFAFEANKIEFIKKQRFYAESQISESHNITEAPKAIQSNSNTLLSNDVNSSIVKLETESSFDRSNSQIGTNKTKEELNANDKLLSVDNVKNSNYSKTIFSSRNKSRKGQIIQKINLTKFILLSQHFSISDPKKKVDEIQIIYNQRKSPLQFHVIPKIGIGNSFYNPKNYSYRFGIDLEAEYKRRKLNYSITSGLSYENIDDYLYQSYEQVYDKYGSISSLGTDFNIYNTINWQNSLLVGYQLSKSFNLKVGLSYDMYVGTIATMQNKRNQELISTENEYTIGRNEEFTNHNFNLIGRLEFRLNQKTQIITLGEFGLTNKLNSQNYPLLLPNINRSLLIGLKYKLF